MLPEIADWRSAQSFTDKDVDQASLDRILSAAQRAPSAKNRQPWRIIVAKDRELRRKIYEASYGQEHVGQAPIILALCTTNVDYRMPNGQHAYPIDIGITSAFIMLQARAEGLGVCAVTTYDESAIKEIFTVPHMMRVVLLLLVGHSEDTGLQKERRPLRQIISYDHW